MPVVKSEVPVNSTKLQLPFEGQWLCFWGGDTLALNYHHAIPSMRYAYDFVRVRKDVDPFDAFEDRSKFYKGGVALNDNSYSFRADILAPSAGQVVRAVNSRPDGRPKASMKDLERVAGAAGNYVMIMHGEEEFSVLAHLRHGSVTVEAGQHVAQGQKIGECGNSGASTDPHLHFHIQDSPLLPDFDRDGKWSGETAAGIKAGFLAVSIVRNGLKLTDQQVRFPIRGDLVTPA